MTQSHGTPESHDERDRVPDAHGASGAVEGPHGATSDQGDDHEHDEMALGAIDWRMWAVGVLGVLVALVVTVGFVVATGFDFRA